MGILNMQAAQTAWSQARCLGQKASPVLLGQLQAQHRRSISCKWGVFEKLGHLRRLHEIPHGRGLVPCGLTYFNRKATSYAFSATIPMIIMQAQRAARIFHQIAGDLARSVGKAGARKCARCQGGCPFSSIGAHLETERNKYWIMNHAHLIP